MVGTLPKIMNLKLFNKTLNISLMFVTRALQLSVTILIIFS